MKILFHFFFPFFVLCMTLTVMLSSCAYFNTFYNAQKYFEAAQARPLTNQGRPNSQAIEEYNKVIRKCGVILTEYKDSKWVDDALFLLAKALYFRGNNQIQALEKFEDLINFYPDSPYVPESIIFTAKIKYELNQKEDAYSILRSFIQNNTYRDDHPKALIEIANMFLADKDFLQTQTYLSMLITRYPKSNLFAEAYLLLGKTYLDNNNYQESLNVFLELNKTRVPKRFILDSKYYIALNYFYLEDYQNAFKYIRMLEKQEFRTDKLQIQNILYARIIAEMRRYEDAIDYLETVVTNNIRTAIASEALYYIAEIYFTKLQNYEKAIEYYNRVRREFSRSDFAERALTRSSVVSQIMQYHRQNPNVSAEQLIAEQFKLAEYYLYILNQPDSALVIYNRIPSQKQYIESKVDSLNIYLESLFQEQSSIIQNTELITIEDTLDINIVNPIQDSLTANIDKTKSSIKVLETDLNLYNTIFIPHAEFIKAVIYNQIIKDSEKVSLILQYLNENYPENRYTEALKEYLNNEKVTFLTLDEKSKLKKYETVMSMYPDSTDYVIAFLDSLTNSEISELQNKSLYSLGFIYYYDLKDTLNAKIYLDTLFYYAPSSEFAVNARNFYDGKRFKILDRLPLIEEELRNKEALEQLEQEILNDTLSIESDLDTLSISEELPDSLNNKSNINFDDTSDLIYTPLDLDTQTDP